VACAPLTGSGDSHHRKSLETLIFNNLDNLSFQNCGKVTTGEPFPWDVELNYDDNLACSGVLISSRDVISSKCLRAWYVSLQLIILFGDLICRCFLCQQNWKYFSNLSYAQKQFSHLKSSNKSFAEYMQIDNYNFSRPGSAWTF